MGVREIKKYPEPVLKKKAEAVVVFDDSIKALIDDMVETMYAAPGIGLAAPQVGVSKRVAVIDISTKDENYPLIVLVNPVILHAEGETEFEEGCLSVPEYTAKVKRYEKVVVGCLDRSGREMELEAGGLLAIAVQHELDHLDGILFIDRLSPIKREFFRKRFRKAQQAST